MQNVRGKLISFIFVLSCLNSCRIPVDEVSLSREFCPEYPTPQGTHSELGLAGYAKVLCSALFVSGREPQEASVNSGVFLLPEEDWEHVRMDIDRIGKVVTLTLRDSIVRKAKYFGSQGCMICKDNEEKVFFTPEIVVSTLGDGADMSWPMGDLYAVNRSPSGLDMNFVEESVNLAFEPPEALTAAFLIVYKGEIIAERYMEGIDMHTQLESWSMGKSITATLIGRLIQQGELSLDDLAPVQAWQREGDPRGKITIRNLLQMSSGLHFTSHRDPDVEQLTPYLDHIYIYTGAVDVFDYSINRPLQFPVGAMGRYRNCDPLTLGFIIKHIVSKRGESYLKFPQRDLFDKIGIREQILETDPYGNFLLTGYDYGTARNWARLGMLYLQDGEWNDERLLPEGFVEFVSTPASAWDEEVYGGLFWLNRTGVLPVPEDAFYMAGGGGQRTIIIPSKDMVIVRLGHFQGSEVGMPALARALEKLMEAF